MLEEKDKKSLDAFVFIFDTMCRDAVNEMKEIIYNKKLNKEIGEYNFQLGKKHFSYDVLEEKLLELLDRVKKVS